MPNLRQLEYLVALDETRHFRRAAERANTTQPTLSEQLKALEVRFGAQLVERTRNKVMITPLGAQIVHIARRMLSDADEIRALAMSGGRELAGILRLGLPASIGPYLLPFIIPELQKHYRDLKLYVREELPSGLPSAMAEGRHDLVLSLLPVNHGEIVSEELKGRISWHSGGAISCTTRCLRSVKSSARGYVSTMTVRASTRFARWSRWGSV